MLFFVILTINFWQSCCILAIWPSRAHFNPSMKFMSLINLLLQALKKGLTLQPSNHKLWNIFGVVTASKGNSGSKIGYWRIVVEWFLVRIVVILSFDVKSQFCVQIVRINVIVVCFLFCINYWMKFYCRSQQSRTQPALTHHVHQDWT